MVEMGGEDGVCENVDRKPSSNELGRASPSPAIKTGSAGEGENSENCPNQHTLLLSSFTYNYVVVTRWPLLLHVL